VATTNGTYINRVQVYGAASSKGVGIPLKSKISLGNELVGKVNLQKTIVYLNQLRKNSKNRLEKVCLERDLTTRMFGRCYHQERY
jgi:hypothetical protein